jgi:hypothetical protein
VLLAVALVCLLGAGISWGISNPGLQSYRPASAVVVASSSGDPASITVRFTPNGGRPVVATTTRLTFLPPAGAPVAVRYDPADPEQVVMEGFSTTTLLTQVLVGAFAVALAMAWFAFRRQPAT